MPRVVLGAVLGIIVVLGSGTVADAATVSAKPDARLVSIAAASGEMNDAHLRVATNAAGYVVSFSDTGSPPVAADGCEEVAGEIVWTVRGLDPFTTEVKLSDEDDHLNAVSPPSPMTLEATLGDGEDEAILGPGGAICGSFLCRVRGGNGADRLVGSDDVNHLIGGGGDDQLIGGEGGNVMTGRRGEDAVQGGAGVDFTGQKDPGDDRYEGFAGGDHMRDTGGADVQHAGAGGDSLYSETPDPPLPDVLDGGTGTDNYIRLCGKGCAISMDGKPNDGVRNFDEGDNVLAERFAVDAIDRRDDRHRVLGPGPDRLIGNGDGNWIFSTKGPDVISGNGGRDLLDSGRGKDVIRALDGLREREVNCGRGFDKAFVDARDRPIVRKNCEKLVVR